MGTFETRFANEVDYSPMGIGPYSAQEWIEVELNPHVKEVLQDNSAKVFDTPLLIGNTRVMQLDPVTISKYTGILSTNSNGWYPHYKGHIGSDGKIYDSCEEIPDDIVLGRYYQSEEEVYRSIQIVNRILVLTGFHLEDCGCTDAIESIQVVGSNIMTSFQPGVSDLDISLVLNDRYEDVNKLMKVLSKESFVEEIMYLTRSVKASCIQFFFNIPEDNGTWVLNGMVWN